ncbi:DUF3969 family protein [Paenibacillus sp. UMB4589-SE434]|uniref:DUF3969 family protein n=1 Tax=Paenibacillus sp. UMB4589-SE434 TaxID=3046314 RepID=UPI00254B0217|nr:DUF3969 family protein [Paenibacillus sp. UMB4589-SE434]MDK8182619.1 DUF3969 family protein [Paenibacillus sp. UMB4589-SE434]
MELKLTICGKSQIERVLSILELGILTALENGVVRIDEIEGYLFNPYTVEYLENLALKKEVIDVIKQGCELEDVESLLPYKLKSTIQALKEETIETLKKLPSPEIPTEKIIKCKC